MCAMSPQMIGEQIQTYPELFSVDLTKILTQNIDLPNGIDTLYAVGNGDSYHAALCAANEIYRRSGVRCIPVPAFTFLNWDIETVRHPEKTLVACISASGSSSIGVSILNKAHEIGVHSIALTGKAECAMNAAAEAWLNVAISEKGRSPGLRTFAASYIGLLRLAIALTKKNDCIDDMAKALTDASRLLQDYIDRAEAMTKNAAAWNWPMAMFAGCDLLEGCARFCAAKFVEGAGVYAAGQELEEWCHVESMAYPLNAPLIILQADEKDAKQAAKLVDVAHRAGRKVIVMGNALSETLQTEADLALFVNKKLQNWLLPIVLHIPAAMLAQKLAEKEGRSMFLSDQPFRLF